MDEVWAEWTRAGVERRLVEAFRAMPGQPVIVRAGRPRLADGRASPMTQVLAWSVHVDDRQACAHLYAWARCQALKESFAAYCRERGWRRSTAEKGRRRAADAIAAALEAGGSTLQVDAPRQIPVDR